MLSFFSIGSGSSGNSYCLCSDDECLMIDAGLGMRTIKKALHNRNIPLTRIRAILATHAHSDHTKSVGAISQQILAPVYATCETHEGILHNPHVHRKVPHTLAKTITPGETYHIEGFQVTPFDVPHDCRGNVGYAIERDGIIFTILTDCGHVTEQIHQHISKTHYLVIEANYDPQMLRDGRYPAYLKSRIASPNGHLENHDCGTALARILTAQTETADPSQPLATTRLRHAWLCHLSQENNTPQTARTTVASVLEDQGITIGKDFQLDVLPRKQPSEVFVLED